LTLLNWLYGWFVLPESLALENRRGFSWTRSNPVGALLTLRRYPMVFGLAGTYFLIYLGHQCLPAVWVLYTSYRYQWTVGQTGLSLAVVGLMAAIVQGGLTRIIVGRLGEQTAALLGMVVGALSYIGYGVATHGWMIYVILVFGSFTGVTSPSVQGLISRGVGANEQGGVQGSLTSLASVAGILGPPVAARLFGYFISDAAPLYLPGAAFFFGAALMAVAVPLALRSFRRAAVVEIPPSQLLLLNSIMHLLVGGLIPAEIRAAGSRQQREANQSGFDDTPFHSAHSGAEARQYVAHSRFRKSIQMRGQSEAREETPMGRCRLPPARHFSRFFSEHTPRGVVQRAR
jgi:MFS family permease